MSYHQVAEIPCSKLMLTRCHKLIVLRIRICLSETNAMLSHLVLSFSKFAASTIARNIIVNSQIVSFMELELLTLRSLIWEKSFFSIVYSNIMDFSTFSLRKKCA